MSTEARGAQPEVTVVHLSLAPLRALATGDLAAANATSPVPVPAYAAGPDWRGVWVRRVIQVAEDPDAAGWVTGIVWDAARSLAVGRAGFHGPPDADGVVEVGYTVLPHLRGRGYARAALTALVAEATASPQVRVVRASVSPDNAASLAVVRRAGFVHVGEQVDDEDGLELVHELAV